MQILKVSHGIEKSKIFLCFVSGSTARSSFQKLILMNISIYFFFRLLQLLENWESFPSNLSLNSW